ncbi:MAG: hypothetical protein ABI840_08025, partial [bacterium]
MKKIFFCSYLLLSIFFINNIQASTYFISNSGSDNNNGLFPAFAWKTITKLNSMMSEIKPGDAVLFDRGGYFTGQINLSASGNVTSPVIFGAYGIGKNPV